LTRCGHCGACLIRRTAAIRTRCFRDRNVVPILRRASKSRP